MKALNENHIEKLSRKGIGIKEDSIGLTIELNPKGMAWILNFISELKHRNISLTLTLLKEISAYQKSKKWKELRYKITSIEAYDNSIYYSHVFYLNGTPPKMFFSCDPVKNINHFTFFHENTPFKIRNDLQIDMYFSKQESMKLKQGDLIIENG
ncbi:hypothetical protein [Bathymodiolus thermophilus thioautotrophic gill symbiont]|uniref:hypothetical protein n=1 Tax=Bathymodiolus thermophilus thioautotrophic gill symbiont TaxID=2360 RepID=UPI0011162E21|nr:hypothetical protein [Bathymodiolus thermophilus thioautotrophic gill symbiont]